MRTVFSRLAKTAILLPAASLLSVSCQAIEASDGETCFVDQEGYTKVFVKNDFSSARFINEEFSGEDAFEDCSQISGEVCRDGIFRIRFNPDKLASGLMVSRPPTNATEEFGFELNSNLEIIEYYRRHTSDLAPKLTYSLCEGEQDRLDLKRLIPR